MIDIKAQDFTTIKRILEEYVPGCEVRAFGSRVSRTAGKHSDFDLAIVGHDKIERRSMVRLKEALEESNVPFRVDVLDWHAISESFRKMIEARYEVIQA